MVRNAAVWVIEDGPENVQVLREAMRLCAFHCDLAVAADGAAAMETIEHYRDGTLRPLPDLVLLDLNLPNVSGQEILRTLKADPQLKSIPVIVLSGSKSQDEIDAVYLLHANAYVVKPDRLDEILSFVASLGAFWLTVASLPTPSRN
ncbi:MAG TPA: response regulator [Bryobacteraceae bacterium]|nr:response regulator [Bryobacteraceae bacterium]